MESTLASGVTVAVVDAVGAHVAHTRRHCHCCLNSDPDRLRLWNPIRSSSVIDRSVVELIFVGGRSGWSWPAGRVNARPAS
jgi:hypothetical protein